MADLDTSVRITAETKSAVENVGRLDQVFERVSRQSGPRVGSMFGTMAQQAISMQGGIGGLSGGLSLLGSSLYTLNPLLGIAGGALAAVAVSMMKKKGAVDESNASLTINLKLVEDLIKRNQDLEGILSSTAEKKTLSLQMEEGTLKNLIAAYGESIQPMAAFAVVADATSIAVDKDTRSLEDLIKRLGEVQRELAEGAEVFGPPIPTLADMVAAENAKIEAAKKTATLLQSIQEQGRAVNANERAEREAAEKETGDRILQLHVEAAQFRVTTEVGSIDQISAAYDALHESVLATYADKIAAAQGSADQEYAINLDLYLRLAQLENSRAGSIKSFTAKTAKLQIDMYSVVGGAFQRLIQGQTQMHGGFAAFFVETMGESIQAVLRAYGALWAAEGAANVISNPVLAATKFRAAAMAGVAAGVVGALTEVAVSQITKERDQSITGIGDITAGAESALGTAVKGRTLVSQGPVTLNYSAILTINGNVLGIDDLFQQFQRWNSDQLRIAGMDTAQRARG